LRLLDGIVERAPPDDRRSGRHRSKRGESCAAVESSTDAEGDVLAEAVGRVDRADCWCG
jgi:hypothetical protein